MDWTTITDDVKMFTLEGESHVAKVVSVYDGDTIKVVFPIFKKNFKWNCRVAGLDTPELRTKDEGEKKNGYYVRDRLREKILDRLVIVKCGEFDKYGRLLVDIYLDELHVNQCLIDKKYALIYDGGTKTSWAGASYIEDSDVADPPTPDNIKKPKGTYMPRFTFWS